jgi:hypothetical protein
VRGSRWNRALLWVSVCMLAGAAWTARAESNNCGEPPESSHYVAQNGDTEDGQHFAVERTFAGQGTLELNVCSGEVHIRPASGDKLKLRVEIASSPSLKMRAYVKDLDVSSDHATISLEFPHKYHAVVTLELPSTTSLKSEINLGAGKLYFNAAGIKGNRELNLGAGDVYLTMVGDHAYANFEANVGMGSFHDHRPGGSSSHFIISRDYQGSGDGHLEVNVGAGSIDIEPRNGETI